MNDNRVGVSPVDQLVKPWGWHAGDGTPAHPAEHVEKWPSHNRERMQQAVYALTAEEVAAVNELRAVAALNSARAERHALRQDAERWRAALSAYERGVVMSHDGRTGEKDGYVTLFLQAQRERKADVA